MTHIKKLLIWNLSLIKFTNFKWNSEMAEIPNYHFWKWKMVWFLDYVRNEFNLLTTNVPIICRANHLTGFYMMETLVVKRLKNVHSSSVVKKKDYLSPHAPMWSWEIRFSGACIIETVRVYMYFKNTSWKICTISQDKCYMTINTRSVIWSIDVASMSFFISFSMNLRKT